MLHFVTQPLFVAYRIFLAFISRIPWAVVLGAMLAIWCSFRKLYTKCFRHNIHLFNFAISFARAVVYFPFLYLTDRLTFPCCSVVFLALIRFSLRTSVSVCSVPVGLIWHLRLSPACSNSNLTQLQVIEPVVPMRMHCTVCYHKFHSHPEQSYNSFTEFNYYDDLCICRRNRNLFIQFKPQYFLDSSRCSTKLFIVEVFQRSDYGKLADCFEIVLIRICRLVQSSYLLPVL